MSAINNHGLSKQINGPPSDAFAIAPSDSVDLAYTTRYIYVGVAGDVTVDFERSGTNVLLKSLAVGMHSFAIRRVYATGTAATNLVGLY